MNKRNILKVFLFTALIIKLFLGFNLAKQVGLAKIFIIEFVYIITTIFLTIVILKDKKEYIRYSMSFLICFDIFNMMLMKFGINFTGADQYYFFHPMCMTLFLLLNKIYIQYVMIVIIINLYISAMLTRTLMTNINVFAIASIGYVIVANLLIGGIDECY